MQKTTRRVINSSGGRQQFKSNKSQWIQTITCHSSSPWMLSGFSFFTATTIPRPLFAGFRVFSSTHPLYTVPNPPSPRTVSGLKFFVAVLNSAKVNIRRFRDSRIRPSGRTSSMLIPLPVLCQKVLLLMLESFPVVVVLLLAFDVEGPMFTWKIAHNEKRRNGLNFLGFLNYKSNLEGRTDKFSGVKQQSTNILQKFHLKSFSPFKINRDNNTRCCKNEI